MTIRHAAAFAHRARHPPRLRPDRRIPRRRPGRGGAGRPVPVGARRTAGTSPSPWKRPGSSRPVTTVEVKSKASGEILELPRGHRRLRGSRNAARAHRPPRPQTTRCSRPRPAWRSPRRARPTPGRNLIESSGSTSRSPCPRSTTSSRCSSHATARSEVVRGEIQVENATIQARGCGRELADHGHRDRTVGRAGPGDFVADGRRRRRHSAHADGRPLPRAGAHAGRRDRHRQGAAGHDRPGQRGCVRQPVVRGPRWSRSSRKPWRNRTSPCSPS